MKFQLFFISLITINILPKTYSQGTQKVPGSISCGYNAASSETCGEPTVSATDLPKEAKSVIYKGILADDTLKVAFDDLSKNNDENIKNMLSAGKSVFLLYFHQNDSELLDVISTNSQDDGQNAKTEMSNLKTFIEPYNNISGIVLNILSYWPCNATDPNLTENLKIYIDEMRNCFPDYGIGVSLYGYYLIDMFAESDSPEWFDLNELDSCIDFYIIDVYNLNMCTEELKDGSTPINGSATKTMEKVKDCITKLDISDDKLYYLYKSTATAINTNMSKCDLTSSKICALPSLDGYCLDPPQSFYDKGAFAKENGAGVIVWDVDLDDDPHGCCQCSTPYPAFYSIMAGFNGDPVPPVCPLLDKQ